MPARVYMNGEIVAPDEARISIFDRGFLYGDSVYETLRVYHGVPFELDAHLERLRQSGERVGFELPWDVGHLAGSVAETLEAAGMSDAYTRIIATRGSGRLGLDPTLAQDPQLIVMVLELPRLDPAWYETGRSAALVSVQRNVKAALDPQAKTGNYMNNVLAAGEASRRSADEAIMLDVHGRVAEGSSANVFGLIEGVWCTPPLDVGILSGITRRTLLALCEHHGIAARERMLTPDELRGANEVFLCSTVRELMPIVRIDDEPVGDGRVGSEVRRLHALYRELVLAQTRSQPPA